MNSTSNAPLFWHVAYTMPKAEKKIFTEMQRQGINSYLPTYKTVKQWSDRKKEVELPLFPNYIFVEVPPVVQWRVLAIQGVVKFVNCDGKPYVIDANLIESLQKLTKESPTTTTKSFTKGSVVRVKKGPLKDLEGTLIEKKGKYRLGVRVEALRQSIMVEVSPADVEPVKR